MLTRSEIFAYAKKATRGAGFSWGMAEEAAMATLALYAAGLDGFAELTAVLEHADGKEQPLSIDDVPVCGLTLGVYLADCNAPAREGDVVGAGIMHALCGVLPEGVRIAPEDAPQVIKDFAHRTYVPESAESRARGAG